LAQRIGVPLRLPPLDVQEAVDYLRHHLRAAGGKPERIATEEAQAMLAAGVQGIPRLLNQALDLALRLAYEAGQAVVDTEAALEALHELGLSIPADDAFEGEPDPAGPSHVTEDDHAPRIANSAKADGTRFEQGSLKPVA
jgi:hypothetical protein